MKKIILAALAATLTLTSFTACAQQEPIEIAGAFDYTDPAKVSERIDALGEITDTSKLADIYTLISDIKCMTDTQFAQVANYGKIAEALDTTASYFNEEDVKLKVMSFNVRNGEYGNGRMELLLSTIVEESPDLVGLQEVGDDWKPFFKENLPEGYARLGHGRKEMGHSEACYVLYKTDKFELLEYKTIWMTDTPDYCSVWVDPETGDSGFPRIATYALLKRKTDGTIFVFANTHLETDQPAQNHQAYWLMEYLTERYGNQDYPIIITGDFNCTEGSPAFNTVVDYGFEPTNKYGESTGTFNAYSYTNGEGEIIDFCFVNEFIPVKSYKVMPAAINGQYVSDHNAIVSEILILPEAN